MSTLPIVRSLLEQRIRWTAFEMEKVILYLGGSTCSDAGLTARIRQLRNQYGLDIKSRVRKGNTWEYWLDS